MKPRYANGHPCNDWMTGLGFHVKEECRWMHIHQGLKPEEIVETIYIKYPKLRLKVPLTAAMVSRFLHPVKRSLQSDMEKRNRDALRRYLK